MQIHLLSLNRHLYSTRRIVEEAQHQGHDVQILNYEQLSASIEANNLKQTNFPAVIIPRIAANMTTQGKGVIQYYQQRGVRSTLSVEALQLARDKYACLEKLQAYGLPTPKTHLVTDIDNIDQLFQTDFRFPIILKMAESTHGHGVLLVQTLSGLKRMLKTFKQFQPLVIQEFIREAAGSDVRAFVVNGKIVASMKRIARKGDFRSNLHRGGKAKAIELTTKDQDLILQAASCIDIGVAGIDLLQSARGLLFIEVNASPGLEGIEKHTGVNVAQSIVKYSETLKT